MLNLNSVKTNHVPVQSTNSFVTPPLPIQQPISLETNSTSQVPRRQKLFCVGWTLSAGIGTAYLSDGSEYSSADHEIQWIQKHKISILGTVYEIRPTPDLPVTVEPPPLPFSSDENSRPATFAPESVETEPWVASIPNRSPLDMATHPNYNRQSGKQNTFPQNSRSQTYTPSEPTQ
jgi:hypothetical protein